MWDRVDPLPTPALSASTADLMGPVWSGSVGERHSYWTRTGARLVASPRIPIVDARGQQRPGEMRVESRPGLPEPDATPPSSPRASVAPVHRQSGSAAMRLAGLPSASNRSDALPPIRPTRGPSDQRLMLTGPEWAEDQRGPTYDQMFPPHGLGMSHPILTWLVLVELLGMAAFPVTSLVFQPLADRGWIVAKIVAFIVLGWLVWIAAISQVFVFDRLLIWSAIGLLVLAGAFLAVMWRNRLLTLIEAHGRGVLAAEL